MSFLIEGCRVYAGGQLVSRPLGVSDGRIVSADTVSNAPVFHFDDCVLLPGFVDVHVHLREPGFSYKETIGTGTLAGGARRLYGRVRHAQSESRARQR